MYSLYFYLAMQLLCNPAIDRIHSMVTAKPKHKAAD